MPIELSPIPEGLSLPEMIITRRTRTLSMSGRTNDDLRTGIVRFFCRSRGHGFLDPTEGGESIFMHISDIEGEFIPRKGDTVTFKTCPMPPKFSSLQAVNIVIKNFTPEKHHKWCEKETPEEIAEDKIALDEEKKIMASRK